MIGGEVLIPGEWNYACVNGKFFHLEKTKSGGFIDDQESFYYTLIYDDWQNDWLTNNVNLCGTINLTGDKDLVKQHLVQTTPLLNNVNNFRYLNGKRYLGEDVNVIIPDDTNWRKPSILSSKDFLTINDELKKLNLGEPNRDKLIIPFLYRTTPKYHWKWLIVKAIKDLEKKQIGIYDVDQSNTFRPTLQVKFNTNELYTISSTDNRALNYGKTLNKGKYIEEIDLSGFTDLIQLSPITLTPEYTSIESQPKFSLRGLCEKIRSRFNWNRNLIPHMEDLVTRVLAEGLGDLINTEVEFNRRKVFKNVTVTPIKRDITWYEPETDLTHRNPTWLNSLDSLIPTHKFYRNFIFSTEESKERDLIMLTGTRRDVEGTNYQDTPEYPKQFVDKWLKGAVDTSTTFVSWLDNYLNRTVSWGTSRFKVVQVHGSSYINPFKELKLCRTQGIQLVLPTHAYKFVEEGNEESDELDFTRTDWFNDQVIMLIPDYERRTHALSIRCPISEDTQIDKWGFFYDISDIANPLKGKPIQPYITTELFEMDESKVDNNENVLDKWVKSRRADINNNGVSPMASFYHMLGNTYTIKYKTYHSYCGNNINYCDYTQYTSPDDANPYQRRAGFSRWHLILPVKVVNDWIEYQVEFTLPYSEQLITLLQRFNNRHKYIFTWKVLNNSLGKDSGHPNPLIYKNNRIQRMDSSDLQKIGKQEVICIWANPYQGRDWLSHIRDIGLISTDQVLEIYGTYGSDFGALFNELLKIYYSGDPKYWPSIQGGQNVAIPLRIYNDTAIDNSLRSWWDDDVPQLSTGMVRPYEGVDYIFYYRFYPIFDENGFGFSDTSTAFKFDNKDYFVMVIPNKYADSSNSVPEYTFRERITNMSRKSNIAYLVNGGWFDANDRSRFMYGGWIFSNNHRDAGWKDADLINARMKLWENEPDFFYEEFTKKEFKSTKTNNPTILNNEYRYNLNGWQTFTITSIDDEIPPFMVKYLDPDKKLSSLFEWKTSVAKTDVDRLNELRSKITAAITDLKVKLATENTWFQLKGTDWYVSVKLNFQDTTTWDFELFTTKPRLIKSKTTDTWKFEYHNEEDVDVLINTSNELTLYGKRISQKSRYTSNTDELDLRLKITPLDDPKQTVASSWYKVEMKTDEQDLIRDIIEIPKEQVRTVDFSVFQREQIFREIELKAAERNSEAQLLEISRDRFKQKDYFEEVEAGRRVTHRGLHAGLDIAFGLTKAMPGWGDLVTGDFSKSIGGLEQAARGAVDAADAAWEYRNVEIDRKARFAIGLREFDIKGARMQQQHLTNRANDMSKLSQMSARIQYPQMNSGLIYREFNKSEGLNDVYITQYYPSGKLLKYIKEYYKEYGYEILVRDYTCIGVNNIKRHLRYSNIFRNEHTNIRVKAMIEARALNGIFVSDTEVFW